MKRVNIQKDVESRRRIAAGFPTPSTGEKVNECIEPKSEQSDGQTTEVPGDEDYPSPPTEPVAPPKRGRKANGNVQKV